MAIEFFTGFEGCGSTNDCRSLFTESAIFNFSSTGGYENGNCITGASSTSWKAIKNVTAAKTKCIGWHLRGARTYNYNSALQTTLCVFRGPDIRLYNTSSGLTAYRGSTSLGSVATTVDSDIHHIEVKCYSHATAGTFQVKLDGVLVLDLDSLNTDGADITSILWGSTYEDAARLDNLFIADDWQGELVSVLLLPSSDDSVQFTPSAGADNYAMVDDAAQDGDTTYVESSTVGHIDKYGYADFAVTGKTLAAISLVTVAKKDDAGARTLQPIAEQDSTDYDIGSAITLTTDYPAAQTEGSIVTLDEAPDATAWTSSKLNGCVWGFEVAS